MEFCATLKSTANLPRESEFFGGRIRGSLNNNVLVSQSRKSLKLEGKKKKIKAGVAFSVLTTENGRETLVS